jgi:hypothetical protein
MKNKGNAKRGISPRLKIWPSDLDLWPWKSIGFQIQGAKKCQYPKFECFFFYYPLANEVSKGYSNATVRPSFRNILVNTLESTTFNGFWPNQI